MFELKVPNHLYDIDDIKEQFDQHPKLYLELYRKDITSEEKKDLIKHQKYIRFMCYQDEPDSRAYMRAYCRDISDMQPLHYLKALELILNNQTSILIEINYSTKAFMFCLQL